VGKRGVGKKERNLSMKRTWLECFFKKCAQLRVRKTRSGLPEIESKTVGPQEVFNPGEKVNNQKCKRYPDYRKGNRFEVSLATEGREEIDTAPILYP